MAKLSTRLGAGGITPSAATMNKNLLMTTQEDSEQFKTYKQQENNMNTNTLKEVTLTLVDNNINLEDDQRIVFQKKGVRTSFTLEEAKMNIIASGEVMEKLKDHNTNVRAKVVNEDILERTGREVHLKPIKLLSDSQLQWRVVETA
jgi:hypothetical protein